MLSIRVPLSVWLPVSVCPNSRTCWLDDFCVVLSLRIVGGSYVKIPRHRTAAFLVVFRPQLNSSLSLWLIVSVNSFHDFFHWFSTSYRIIADHQNGLEETDWLKSTLGLALCLFPCNLGIFFLETSYPTYYLYWRSPNRESQEAFISCHQRRLLSWPGGCSTWQVTGRVQLCQLPTGIKEEDRWSHISDSSRRPGGGTMIELIELLGVGLGFPKSQKCQGFKFQLVDLWLKILPLFREVSISRDMFASQICEAFYQVCCLQSV